MTTQPRSNWRRIQNHKNITNQSSTFWLISIHFKIELFVLVRKSLKIFIDQKNGLKTELNMEHTKLANRVALINFFCF